MQWSHLSWHQYGLQVGGGWGSDSTASPPTIARQEYDYTKLLALSETGQQYVEDFTFPSGCKCYQQSTGWSGYRFELARSEQREEILTDQQEPLDPPRDQNKIN